MCRNSKESIGFSFSWETVPNGTQTLKDQILNIIYDYDIEYVSEMGDVLIVCIGEQSEIYIKLIDGEAKGNVDASVAGPGFHKNSLELLEKLSKELNIKLKITDTAGFYKNRDFEQLQQFYIEWIKSVMLKAAITKEQCFLNWADRNWIPMRNEDIITSMGAFTCLEIKEIDEQKKWNEFAQNYFIWFHEEKESYYQRNAAIYTMWNDVYWGDAQDEDSIALAENLINSLQEARNQSPNIQIPIKEYEEMTQIAGVCSKIEAPYMELPCSVGYLRGIVKHKLPNNWSIILHGEFRRVDSSSEEYPVKFYSRNKRIHFTLSCRNNDEYKRELIQGEKLWKQYEEHRFVTIDSFSYTHNGEQWNQMTSRVQFEGNVVQVEFEGKADEWDSWAIQAFESIRYIEK